jgi:hypothetical protein
MTGIRGSQGAEEKKVVMGTTCKWSTIHMFWRWLIFSSTSYYEYDQLELSRAWSPQIVRNPFQLLKEKRPNILFL